ncbi:hypothetical protein [Clostridium sp.]|jgi:hypothetical protein|uniref:hypothetical protein n=1 Tax=Clostridium sp. TaxID=1506 RepID=UPI003A398969
MVESQNLKLNLNSSELDLIRKISSQIIDSIIENALNTRQVDALLELIQVQVKECKLNH